MNSVANLRSGATGARDNLGNLGSQAGDAAKGAAGAAKDAADVVAKLPLTRIVAGRERCVTAANGAPDCRAAAQAICRGYGLGAGRSVDIQTAENCPASIFLSGRAPAPGECKLESYVTRAVCQ